MKVGECAINGSAMSNDCMACHAYPKASAVVELNECAASGLICAFLCEQAHVLDICNSNSKAQHVKCSPHKEFTATKESY